MPRKEHFKKRLKKKSERQKHHTQSTSRPSTGKREIPPEISAKRRKVNEGGENVSSDSADETDHFNNLLSSFNVPTTDTVVETDDSDSSDSDDTEFKDSGKLIVDAEVDGGGGGSSNDDDNNDTEGNSEEISGDDDTGDSDKDDCIPQNTANDVVRDPFVNHFKYDIHENLLETIQSDKPLYHVVHEHWPTVGSLQICLPNVKKVSTVSAKLIDDDVVYAPPGCVPSRTSCVDFDKIHVKSQLHSTIANANMQNVGGEDTVLTALQREIFSIVNTYQDLYYPSRTLDNGEELRFIYCLHSINHILKTRTKIVRHNMKIQDRNIIPDEYRDQGLTRPKVLILVPFKDSAFRVIKVIMSLLHPDDKGRVINKARFLEEFTGGELSMPRKNPRPEDYEKTFSGNTDDNFKLGISITRKSLKLYVDFYSADIIVASPLGLRLIIGAEGEHKRDYDFLASIEILILDQTEIFLMQNWDHVLHVMNHLHLQPRESHGTDFSRVRSWAINGWTRFYRQTLVLSSLTLPEINALFNKKCCNYAGKVRVEKFFEKGSVCQVVIQLSQIFHRFNATGGQTTIDSRFEFFTKKILPQFTDTNTNHVLIYVPSYFDYVRIRNYLKREDMSFVQICEYSKDNKIARARDLFFHNEVHFLLYSERAHFFRRLRIKGIRHIIFYQPPTIPHFYSELCNFMAESNQSQMETYDSGKNITVLYTKTDGLQVSAIVGTERAARMLSSDRDVHMFVSGE